MVRASNKKIFMFRIWSFIVGLVVRFTLGQIFTAQVNEAAREINRLSAELDRAVARIAELKKLE